MSEAFVNGQFIGHVSEVQVALVQEAEPISVPPAKVSLPFQCSAVAPDFIDAMLFGLEEHVEAPREATFKGHGVTGTLRNLAFHDDGQELVGTDGCVRMAVTMTGILEDMHFESAAKNRAWRRLKRRAMNRNVRIRYRSDRRARKHVKLWLRYMAATPFSLDKLNQAFHHLNRACGVASEELRLYGLTAQQFSNPEPAPWEPPAASPGALEDINTMRERLGLPPMTQEQFGERVFTLGSKLITYNQWNEWQDAGGVIRNSLDRWPPSREPQPGDDFWMDADPLYHHGKVYGYVLYRVDFVENGGIHHSGGFCSRECFYREARLLNPSERPGLWAFLDANPRACNL